MAKLSLAIAGAFTLASCVAASSGAAGAKPSPAAATVTSQPPEQLQATEAPTAPPKQARSKARPAAGHSDTQKLMDDHFGEADQIRVAVVAGKLKNAIKPAHKLIYASELETLPTAWKDAVARMQDSAKRLKGSNDMVMAAASTADIGTSCGYCHKRLGGPSVPQLQPPTSDGSLQQRMRQHAWATERLWEGLYVPSLNAWNAGVDILSETPFPDEMFQKKGMYARTAADDFARIVARAPRKAGPKAQAATYAALLATCATCHLAID